MAVRVNRRLVSLVLLLCLGLHGLGWGRLAWMCEGRICSTNALTCCCNGSEAKRHSSCEGIESERQDCKGKCGCEATSDGGAHLVAARAFAFNPAEAWDLDAPVTLPSLAEIVWARPIPEAPLLANPPPVAVSQPLYDGAPLRAPPAPIS